MTKNQHLDNTKINKKSYSKKSGKNALKTE